ncbi:MAG: hypothetical protein ACJ71C_03665, partial [Nitrososphaeraceae archaeon]
DKTDKNIEMLKVNDRYIDLLRKMYQVVNIQNAVMSIDYMNYSLLCISLIIYHDANSLCISYT